MEEVLLNGPKKSVKNSTEKNKEPALPLSKRQELNNHIVCMRNSVRQARVQIINRLISQIQKYKNRKGEPKEQEKAKRKADRILEEIQILKKIKKDKVSLYALQDTQKLDVVLNNPGSSSEERVLARLSHHNVIIRDVEKYRVPNPNWDKQIPVLLEMTREKRRKKKEQTNPVESQTPAKIPQKKDSKTDDKESYIGEKGDSDDSESESDSDTEEKVVNDSSDNSDQEEEKEDKQRSAKSNVLKRKIKKLESDQESKTKLKDIVKPPSSQTPLVDKSEGTVKIKFLTDLNDLEEDNFEQVNCKNAIDITRTTQVKRPKSAFFVGGVDEPKSKQLESDFGERFKSFEKPASFNPNRHSGQSKPVYKKGKLISKPIPSNRSQENFGQNRKGQISFRQTDNRFGGGNGEPLGAKKARFSADYQEDRLLNPSSNGTAAEKLHPSWEAKKKQQQISLTEFKGKKIVFDNDD